MTRLAEIHGQHPHAATAPHGAAGLLVDLTECSMVCAVCADACINEPDGDLSECVRVNLDCANICAATASLMARLPELHGGLLARQLTTCAEMCERCARQCNRHRHDHCRTCAEVCERTAVACREVSRHLRTNAES